MTDSKVHDVDIYEEVSGNLIRILPVVRKQLLFSDIISRDHKMPMSQIQILSVLHENGSMSITDLSGYLGIAKPNITPLIDRLVSQGYVSRSRDTRDKRIINVCILENDERFPISSNISGNFKNIWQNYQLDSLRNESGVAKLQDIRSTVSDRFRENFGKMDFHEVLHLNDSLLAILDFTAPQ